MWQGNRNYCSSNTLSLYYINIWRVYKVKVECHSMSGGAFRGWQFGFLQQMKCVTTHTLDGRWPPLLTRLSTFINKLSHIIRFLLLIYYASNIMRNMNALLWIIFKWKHDVEFDSIRSPYITFNFNLWLSNSIFQSPKDIELTTNITFRAGKTFRDLV